MGGGLTTPEWSFARMTSSSRCSLRPRVHSVACKRGYTPRNVLSTGLLDAQASQQTVHSYTGRNTCRSLGRTLSATVAFQLNRSQGGSRHTEDQPYCYSTLPETRGHYDVHYFRLLELLPGQSDDCIRTELRIFTLREAPSFETISYSWSNDERSKKIACGGRTLNVPLAVVQLLKGLRSCDKPRLLWVDVVCIDQANTLERSEQVNIMRYIYAQATRTVVWLGPGDANTQDSFKVVSLLSEAATKLRSSGLDKHPSGIGFDLRSSVRSHVEKAGAQKFSLEDTRPALLKLFERRWFERLWVVQEITVSNGIVVRQGPLEVDWTTFSTAIVLYVCLWFGGLDRDGYVLPESSRRSLQNLQNTCNLIMSRAEWQEGAVPSLQYLLSRYRFRRVTDQRDKIYALVGISDANSTTSAAMFDYERSVSDAFRLWTIHILRHEQSLRFISAANRYATPLSSVEYSWVPDWNLQHDGLGSPERPGDFKTTQGSKLSFKLGDNDTILGLEGYTVDSVVAVGGVMDTSYDAKRIFGSVENGLKVDEQEVWRSWEQVAQIRRNRVYEATGQSISDAYGQTISYGSPIIRDDEAASGRNAYREWYLYQQPWRKTRLLHMSRHMWCLSAWLLTQWGLGRTGSSNRKRNVGILQFSERVVHARHRRMIRTGQGYIGLAAHGAKVGDRVALFQGGPDPLIIRPTGKQRWILVGEAYLHGIMQGELWNPKKCETFWIC